MIHIDPMNFYYDSEADIVWIGSTKTGEYSHTIEVGDIGINIDLDKKGNIMGVEILAASRPIRKSALKKIEIPKEGIEARRLMKEHYPRKEAK